MNKKRFEAVHNDKGAWDIIDYDESEKINGFVIYNDLGSIYFSSAPQLCDLLNELNDECEFLEIENESLEDGATKYAELYHKSLKENEQLKSENKELKLQNEELLYQIGHVGKNNKTCRECECFIPEIKYCYMWDMEVEADDVVVACDQRKVK